jgi:hypothetical protein
MAEISNQLLAVLVIASIAISIGGTLMVFRLFWEVPAVTGMGTQEMGEANVTVGELVSILLDPYNITFGTLQPGESDNTTDDSPAPLVLYNAGTVLANVTMNTNSSVGDAILWNDTTLHSECTSGPSTTCEHFTYFSELNESGSVDTACGLACGSGGCQDSWNSVNLDAAAPEIVVDCLKFVDSTDSVKVHLNVTVPTDESAGPKGVFLVFYAKKS